jgi:hypothetical protein
MINAYAYLSFHAVLPQSICGKSKNYAGFSCLGTISNALQVSYYSTIRNFLELKSLVGGGSKMQQSSGCLCVNRHEQEANMDCNRPLDALSVKAL